MNVEDIGILSEQLGPTLALAAVALITLGVPLGAAFSMAINRWSKARGTDADADARTRTAAAEAAQLALTSSVQMQQELMQQIVKLNGLYQDLLSKRVEDASTMARVQAELEANTKYGDQIRDDLLRRLQITEGLLKSANDNHARERAEWTRKIDNTVAVNTQLQTTVAEMLGEVQEQEQRLTDAIAINEEMKRENAELRSDLRRRVNEIQALQVEKGVLERQVNELRSEVRALREELNKVFLTTAHSRENSNEPTGETLADPHVGGVPADAGSAAEHASDGTG